MIQPPQELELLTRFSNLTRLLRATSHLFRFVQYLKDKTTIKNAKKFITPDELQRAKIAWVKYVQQLHFSEQIACLTAGKLINEKNSLIQLNPQLDHRKVLIVRGRLERANLPENQRFPIKLPAQSHLTRLIIDHAHKTTIHGTIHLTLARVRQEFWVLNGRNMVKSHIHKCIPCYRQKPRPLDQLMAPLPSIKTAPARAFIHCGLDFAGPIDVKTSDKRNAPVVKGYICVFVCMVSKAIHLEAVGDLSTKRFISALQRMMAKRGICSDIYCDRGTNFQGASNELPRLFLQASSSVSIEIAKLFADDQIKFHFNPPNAPNWGGQWESFVKLTKHHLHRVTTSIKLTFEETSTLLAQIEACINSRPLNAITSDPDDLDPLTAGHLLIGSPLNLIPEPSLLSLKDNTLDRFQAVQKSLQVFWKRFYVEYLHQFHPRKKWFRANQDLRVNDLVVVIDDNLPLAKWLMARVTKIHPSADGLIRLVTLRTKSSEIQRPIAKLCKLLAAPEDVPEH